MPFNIRKAIIAKILLPLGIGLLKAYY